MQKCGGLGLGENFACYAESLERRFTKEEIHNAILEMDGEKSLDWMVLQWFFIRFVGM